MNKTCINCEFYAHSKKERPCSVCQNHNKYSWKYMPFVLLLVNLVVLLGVLAYVFLFVRS